MIPLFYIDPGKKYYSWSAFRDRTLIALGYETDLLAPPPAELAPHRAQLLIEKPRVYSGRRNEDPNDLIDLAWAGGIVSRHFASHRTIYPSDWKGTASKTNHQRWIQEALTPQEKTLLVGLPEYKLVQVLDAVGIGLRHNRRM